MKIESLPASHVVAEFYRAERDDGFWIGVSLTDGRKSEVGPFDTEDAAQRALDDLQNMARSLGGIDLPLGPAN